MTKIIKVGQMPGVISEVVVPVGTSVAEVISIAGLDATGFEVKVDGNTATDPSEWAVSESTQLILLAKQVKGNSTPVKVGKMPGVINEFFFQEGTTYKQALEIAGLDTTGFEVKADGRTITDQNEQIGDVALILLAKQVKGNSTPVKVGKMPGVISEFLFEEGTSFRKALEIAELDTTGFEVKADGRTVTNLDESIEGTALILLAKQVKGN